MTILVTGATGSVGRLVVDELLARDATGVRALTVDPARAALPGEVEVAVGSVRRPAGLGPALRGVERMYLAPAPDTAPQVLAAAREAGVRLVVDLSGEPESWWGGVTRAVEASGLPWAHLWPGDFAENCLVWAAQVRCDGCVREPWPEAASAPIAMRDVAAVAAAVLLSGGHEGRAYGLTGPQVLTRREMVRLVGEALGRDVPFVQVERDEAVAVLEPVMGEGAAWYLDEAVGAYGQHPPEANRLVQELTGRPATTFAEWARAHADAFR